MLIPLGEIHIYVKMELLVKLLLICAVSFIVCSKERLPRPLPDEDHEMLKKCLERNEMEMKSDYSNLHHFVFYV